MNSTIREPWKESIDKNTGRKYYWNPLTKATQWETPTKTPPYNQVHQRGVQQHGPEYPNQMGQQPEVILRKRGSEEDVYAEPFKRKDVKGIHLMKKGRRAEAKDMNENSSEDEHDKVHKGKILMFA